LRVSSKGELVFLQAFNIAKHKSHLFQHNNLKTSLLPPSSKHHLGVFLSIIYQLEPSLLFCIFKHTTMAACGLDTFMLC
jgi:hypothetical protein